jgi:hypothetical protein
MHQGIVLPIMYMRATQVFGRSCMPSAWPIVHASAWPIGAKSAGYILIRSDRINREHTVRAAGRPIRMARSAGPLPSFFLFLLVVCSDGLQN